MRKHYLQSFLIMAVLMFLPSLAHAVSCTLNWNASTSPDVAGYKIYSSTITGNYTNPLKTVGKVITTDCSLLGDGKTHFFVVTAYDTSGNESPHSNEVSKLFPIDASVKTVTDTAGVVWALMPSNTPTEFRVYRNGADLSLTAGSSNASDMILGSDGLAYFAGTGGDTQWWIYTVATGWIVKSPPTTVPPPATISTPVLVVSSSTKSGFVVSWTNQAGVTYDLRHALVPISWGSAASLPCTVSPCTVTGLLPNTTYELQAVGYTGAAGSRTWSAISTATRATTLADVVPPPPSGGLVVTSSTPDKIVMTGAGCKSLTTSTTGSTKAVPKRTITCVR